MGDWGNTIFEHDQVLDWVDEFERQQDFRFVEETFNAVLSATYLEIDDCCDGLGAAEVIAAMNGKPTENLPAAMQKWLTIHPQKPSPDLITTARGVTLLVRNDAKSEARALYEDAGEAEFNRWLTMVDDLLAHL